jgi:hypothetical protein
VNICYLFIFLLETDIVVDNDMFYINFIACDVTQEMASMYTYIRCVSEILQGSDTVAGAFACVGCYAA